MGWGFYGGLVCIVILLGLIVAILLTPPAPDSSYLDDDDWPDHPAHSGHQPQRA